MTREIGSWLKYLDGIPVIEPKDASVEGKLFVTDNKSQEGVVGACIRSGKGSDVSMSRNIENTPLFLYKNRGVFSCYTNLFLLNYITTLMRIASILYYIKPIPPLWHWRFISLSIGNNSFCCSNVSVTLCSAWRADLGNFCFRPR